jgi:predicted dehydrogenase
MRREEAERMAPKARVVADLEPALADPRVEGVVVASPGPTHAPIALAALARGKHLLVEKPLAPTGAEARDMVRRARRAQRLLGVGHLLLHHPAVERLKRWVDAGRLGRLRYLHAQRTNIGRVRDDEGALGSLAPHDVSLMAHLLGRWPVGVCARGTTWAQPRLEDVVFLVLRFPGGVLGHIHLSWLDPLKVRKLSVVGENRMAVFDDVRETDRLVLHRRDPPFVDGSGCWRPGREGATVRARLPAREPLREQLRAFVRAIRDGTPLRAPGEDGVRTMCVIDAAVRSLARAGAEEAVRLR